MTPYQKQRAEMLKAKLAALQRPTARIRAFRDRLAFLALVCEVCGENTRTAGRSTRHMKDGTTYELCMSCSQAARSLDSKKQRRRRSVLVEKAVVEGLGRPSSRTSALDTEANHPRSPDRAVLLLQGRGQRFESVNAH